MVISIGFIITLILSIIGFFMGTLSEIIGFSGPIIGGLVAGYLVDGEYTMGQLTVQFLQVLQD
jgi:Family of unknown function (DUF5518)